MRNLLSMACIAGALLVALPPNALALQTTLRVNAAVGKPGGGPPSFKYDSIRSAMTAAVAGDTVQVEGFVHGTSQPQGYSELPYAPNPNSFGEGTFPITVKNGVRLKWDPATPVAYVYSTNASPPTALFSITSATPAAQQTSIEGLTLFGGQSAIAITAANGNALANVRLEKLRLSWNGTAVGVGASNGSDITNLVFQTCMITDSIIIFQAGTPNYTGVPNYRAPSTGLFFSASHLFSQSPGHIFAAINNLTTSGAFLAAASGARVVDVTSTGRAAEHQGAGRISLVSLTFSGGLLDGAASDTSSTTGWTDGIHAFVQYQDDPIYDYKAAFEIRLIGTKITRMRRVGIHAEVGAYVRGHVLLDGGTEIYNNGSQHTGAPSGPATPDDGTGIYATCGEGYLSVESTEAEVRSNWGHGIYASATGTASVPSVV